MLENLRFAQEILFAGRIAAETDENADDLDIDHGMIVPEEVIEDSNEEVAMPAEDEQVRAKQRRKYSCEQLDVLNQEFMKGSARMKNAEIAKEISRLNGAREVDATDVRRWMVNKRKANDNSEGASFLLLSNFVRLRWLATETESD